jgi:hypothetical protein
MNDINLLFIIIFEIIINALRCGFYVSNFMEIVEVLLQIFHFRKS